MLDNFKKLYALKRLTPILLLSHMRANTSLLSHILGSNPEINGYYEMHMGYYSWKSLIRQKLLYLEKHNLKPNSRYIFDKVLHNYYDINCKLLLNYNAVFIFSLRNPYDTISSIVSYYGKINSSHECATFGGAAKYYQDRLEELKKYSIELKGKFIYLDAESIKLNSEDTFRFLENELFLKWPLSSEYDLQKLTGSAYYGDRSDNLKAGKIINKTNDHGIMLDNKILIPINEHYQNVRNLVISNARCYLQTVKT